MDDKINTQALMFDGKQLIIYSYNANKIQIEDIVHIEQRALWQAAQRQWRLFKIFQSEFTDVFELTSFN